MCDGQTDGQKDEWTDRWTEGQSVGQMNGRINGLLNERKLLWRKTLRMMSPFFIRFSYFAFEPNLHTLSKIHEVEG